MSNPAAAATVERASASDWLAVAAGTLGAMMAMLDISIVNSALPTIQGEIGASGTEGTWIATSFLVAEIIIIPLAGWLQRLLGMRNFLLISTIGFIAFSMICGFAQNLNMMILGRVGQGITGGALIPTGMTIIATRLPPHQQAIGNSLFGATAILGPLMGPVLGGWLTENMSWHYSFFLNLPVGAALLLLLVVAMPNERPRFDLIGEADWLGVAGLILGLGGLTVVLEEGQREQWFASATIVWLTIMAVAGFSMLMAGQLWAPRPVIRLRLLLDRQFGAVIIMAILIGMVIYGTSYVIPQFLSAIAHYNALQSGQVVLLSGVPMILFMPFMPWIIRNVPIHISVLFGMALLGISAYMETELTVQSTGSDFVVSQLMRGFGTVCVMMFLNQAAIRSVPRSLAPDAAGLYNAARNLGGSFALAGIAVVQDQRLWLHSRRMEESLDANALTVQSYLDAQSSLLGSQAAALRAIEQMIQAQALTMTFVDLFWMLIIGIAIATPFAIFLRPLPQHAVPVAAH
ncbi:DHA2 family multidrug resistance protein [Sphingobium sp. OAS761]|uniref:MDR family MFS transporter n=1 Tax=Sphingobium sp. OAS761 TaxID=2817901 RepID=UPI00209CBDD2|nr:DHA2 family multidrug resistance protein [Sphingobium sp. OAS761]